MAVTEQRGQEAAAAQPGQRLETAAAQWWGQEAVAVPSDQRLACLDAENLLNMTRSPTGPTCRFWRRLRNGGLKTHLTEPNCGRLVMGR